MLKSRIDSSYVISALNENTDGEECSAPYSFTSEYTIPGRREEVISYDEPRFQRYGNCRHTKIIRNLNSAPYYGGRDTVHTGHTFMCSDRRAWYSKIQQGNPPVGQANIKDLCAEAYSTMKPSLDSGFSLSNFLIELAEFKWIIKAFKKAKKSYDFVNHVRKTKVGKTFDALESVAGIDTGKKGVTKNMSSAYLMYQFGWKLFIKDLMELYTLLANMDKTLHDYASRQHIPQVRHFEKWLYKNETETTWPLNRWRVSYRFSSVFHATMRYKYTIEGLDSDYALIKGILDVLGLKFNASVVWEAIPFSFVVDWFFNVGDSLKSRYAKDYLESNVTILDFCCSVKEYLTEEAWIDGEHQPAGYLGNIETTTFERRRCLPETSGFGVSENDRYGTKQVLLSTALLLA